MAVTELMWSTEQLRLVLERTLMMSGGRQQRLDDDQWLLCMLTSIRTRTRINPRQHDVTVITFTCNQHSAINKVSDMRHSHRPMKLKCTEFTNISYLQILASNHHFSQTSLFHCKVLVLVIISSIDSWCHTQMALDLVLICFTPLTKILATRLLTNTKNVHWYYNYWFSTRTSKLVRVFDMYNYVNSLIHLPTARNQPTADSVKLIGLPSKPRTWSWWRGNSGRSSWSEGRVTDDDVIMSAYVGSTGLVAEPCDLHDASKSFLTDVQSLPVRWRSRTDIISCADSLFTEPSDLWPAAAAATTTRCLSHHTQ